MKYTIAILAVIIIAVGCSKDNEEPDMGFSAEGYWQVTDPTYSFNNARNLFYLFRGDHVFYRYSFLKAHDFNNLASRPQSDSIVSYYQIKGNQLMLPNPTPSASNVVPGNDLISESADQLVFTRFVILSRDPLNGSVTKSRTDTITYNRVTDAAQIAYFNNYLKAYHP